MTQGNLFTVSTCKTTKKANYVFPTYNDTESILAEVMEYWTKVRLELSRENTKSCSSMSNIKGLGCFCLSSFVSCNVFFLLGLGEFILEWTIDRSQTVLGE